MKNVHFWKQSPTSYSIITLLSDTTNSEKSKNIHQDSSKKKITRILNNGLDFLSSYFYTKIFDYDLDGLPSNYKKKSELTAKFQNLLRTVYFRPEKSRFFVNSMCWNMYIPRLTAISEGRNHEPPFATLLTHLFRLLFYSHLFLTYSKVYPGVLIPTLMYGTDC